MHSSVPLILYISASRIKDGGWKRMSAAEVALTIAVHGLYSLLVVYHLPQLLY